jgi:hypothetical protein
MRDGACAIALPEQRKRNPARHGFRSSRKATVRFPLSRTQPRGAAYGLKLVVLLPLRLTHQVSTTAPSKRQIRGRTSPLTALLFRVTVNPPLALKAV